MESDAGSWNGIEEYGELREKTEKPCPGAGHGFLGEKEKNEHREIAQSG